MQTGSKAARAGLRKGDIITSVNQEEIAGPDEFAAQAKSSAKRLLLTLIRDGHTLFLAVQ